MRALPSFLSALALAFAAGAAPALPTLAIDADPDFAGIQSARDIWLGESFDVEVVIAGVAAQSPLQAFELDVEFDAATLAALSVLEGSFPGGATLVLEADVAAPDVNFALARVGASDAAGGGVLARIRLRAIAEGPSALALERVLLSAPFGAALAFSAASGATIQVLPVPEPAGLQLLAAPAAWLVWRRGRRRA